MYIIMAFKAFAALIIFVALLLFLRRARRGRISYEERVGRRGEARVNRILRRLPKEKYALLSDIMIQKADGGTSQIDHIVLSECGIFVIETKNYQGWIFGKESSEQWMQVIYGRKYSFRNPVKQNWGHVCALKGILSSRFPGITYFPIVVFAGSATLKDIEVSVPVIYDDELLNTIKDYCEEGAKKCLSPEQAAQIKDALKAASITDKACRIEHNLRIRDIVIKDELKAQNLICPKCSGRLVLREGKYGSFYG